MATEAEEASRPALWQRLTVATVSLLLGLFTLGALLLVAWFVYVLVSLSF